MFESAMGRSEASSTRLGTGAILSAGVHALVAAVVFVVPGKTKAQQNDAPPPVIVEFVQPKAPAGSPGPAEPVAKPASPAPRPKPAVRIPDKPTPEPVPDQPDPPKSEAPAATETAGPPGDGAGAGSGSGTGTGTGNGSGTGNGPPEEKPTTTVINWNGTMERPVQIAGPSHPEYPRNAMLQHREGTVITRCRITTDGAVRDCSILSGDVMLQQAALDALAQYRYRPFMYQGVPVSVWYTFRFIFKLQ